MPTGFEQKSEMTWTTNNRSSTYRRTVCPSSALKLLDRHVIHQVSDLALLLLNAKRVNERISVLNESVLAKNWCNSRSGGDKLQL